MSFFDYVYLCREEKGNKGSIIKNLKMNVYLIFHYTISELSFTTFSSHTVFILLIRQRALNDMHAQ